TDIETLLRYKTPPPDPLAFGINMYLARLPTIKSNGKCRNCGGIVPWARDRATSHKRTSCPSNSAEDKKKFFQEIGATKRGQQTANNVAVLAFSSSKYSGDGCVVASEEASSPPKRIRIGDVAASTWIDCLSMADRDGITAALAALIFRTGVPFRIVESGAMRHLVDIIPPSRPVHPNAKQISGSIFNQ
ncbi:hypothetical protein L915_02238, partial [Phytophthora nicotianae]